MCSLNQKVSPNCSPENLKTNSEFTERELFLIENRSGFTVQTLCKNHERKYLTFYIQKQTTCCDPLNKHCDEKKTNSLRAISFKYEQDFHCLYPRILEGNKICSTCRKIIKTASATCSEETASTTSAEEIASTSEPMPMQFQSFCVDIDAYTDPLILMDKINDSLKTLDLEKVNITKLKNSKFRLKLLQNVENKFKALFKKLLELDESESSQDQGN